MVTVSWFLPQGSVAQTGPQHSFSLSSTSFLAGHISQAPLQLGMATGPGSSKWGVGSCGGCQELSGPTSTLPPIRSHEHNAATSHPEDQAGALGDGMWGSIILETLSSIGFRLSSLLTDLSCQLLLSVSSVLEGSRPQFPDFNLYSP